MAVVFMLPIGFFIGYFNYASSIAVALWGAAVLNCVFLFLITFVTRCKAGTVLKNNVIWYAIRLLWRILKAIGRWIGHLVRSIPIIWRTALVILAAFIFALAIGSNMSVLSLPMLLLYLLLAVFALYIAIGFATLQRGSKALAEGDYSKPVDTRFLRGDLKRCGENLNKVQQGVQRAVDERLRSEEQKRKSEWKALQAQIQPHFLYNTLDSIIWMSHAGRNAEVVEMTSALAALLRSSIGDGSDTNTLKTEIAHVRSYLTIQKMRYNEKLRYEIDLDPQTEDCLLPKLILQPLVENAIYHGIKVKQQGGTVRIESLLEEDRLLITVEDDGVGMTPEQLETILDKKESDAESTKIGVYNVNERLQLFFGPDAVMKYYSTPGVRTMVMLVLPIVRGKEEDSHAED